MENKKMLKVNCATCDVRNITEEVLSAYQSVKINCAILLTSPEAQKMLARWGVAINMASTLNLEQNVKFKMFNGSLKIGPSDMPEENVVLVLNGSLTIAPGSEEVLKRYEQIVVNGSVSCPKSTVARVGTLTVNGSLDTYPDGAILLNDTTVLDRTFHLRAKQDGLYYASDRVVAVAADINFAALTAKNVRFATEELVVSESNAEAAVSMVDERTEIIIVPDGCAYVDDRATLDEALIRRYGGKLFIDGSLTIDRDSEPLLEKIEYLRVDGDIKVVRSLRDKVAGLDAIYNKLKVVAGHTVCDYGSLPVTRALLEQARDGLSIEDCANVVFDPDVDPELIREKLVSLSDCSSVLCSEEQAAALRLIAEDVAYMGPAQETPEDEDSAEDENTVRINCASYSF